MQNADPPTGWKPTTSTLGGAGFGLALAQIIIAVCDQYFKTPLSPELASAVTTVTVAAIGYIFPDGGRK